MLLLPGFPVWAFIDLMFGCLLRLLRWVWYFAGLLSWCFYCCLCVGLVGLFVWLLLGFCGFAYCV